MEYQYISIIYTFIRSAVRARAGSWSWKPYTYKKKQICDSELRFIRPGKQIVFQILKTRFKYVMISSPCNVANYIYDALFVIQDMQETQQESGKSLYKLNLFRNEWPLTYVIAQKNHVSSIFFERGIDVELNFY